MDTYLVLIDEGVCETIGCYDSTGSKNNSDDIINIPVKHKRKVWFVFTRDGVSVYMHKPSIVQNHILAIVEREIEFEEGEGL